MRVRVINVKGARKLPAEQKSGMGKGGSQLRPRFLWNPGLFPSVTPAVAGFFTFKIGSKAHAMSAAVGEFYAGGLESTSERGHGRAMRSQYARSTF